MKDRNRIREFHKIIEKYMVGYMYYKIEVISSRLKEFFRNSKLKKKESRLNYTYKNKEKKNKRIIYNKY